MARCAPFISSCHSTHFSGAGTNYVVITPSGVIYVVFIEMTVGGTGGAVKFAKSTDGGASWTFTTVSSGATTTQLSVWYDRWSGISGDLIHCAYTNSANDDTNYRSIDTASADALSSETTIFAGTSTTNGGALSIARARGGNIYCKACIDAGAEGGFFRSTDVGANWTSRTNSEALATQDQFVMLPGWAADNQDMMCFFWDASADEISRCLYDDSADSWAESSIAATMLDQVATTNFPHFAAAVDITNSQNLLVAWSAVDAASADLRCWKVTEAAITEVTNVVLNSTDDQGLCAISIDTSTDDWYVFYFGKSDGSETFNGFVQIYYKKSTDDGATWGSETALDPLAYVEPTGLFACPRQAVNDVPSTMVRIRDSALIFNGPVPVASPGGGVGVIGG